MKSFEEKYFQQPFYYVGNFKFDLFKSEIVLSVIADPETDDIEGTFTFQDIESYSGEFETDEYDSMCLEPIIGIDESVTENEYRYLINFSIGEVSFRSKSEVIVNWQDPNKCRLYVLHKERIKIET